MKLLALLAATLLSFAQAQTFDKAKLDSFLNRLAEKNKGMGSLVLAREGAVVYNHSFGQAYFGETARQPITETTKFRISSITKTYTAVLAFQLIEEKKLALHTTIDKYLPQIPNASKITIAHILGHRSGIHDLEADGAWGMQARSHEEVLARIAQALPDFEPGSQHRYSNAAFNILGRILEQASGVPYAELLKNNIAAKLNFRNTYLATTDADPKKNEALSYRFIDGWKEARELHPSIPGAAGAILSNPTEMAAFIHALFEGKLISRENLKLMTTLQDGEGMGLEPFTFAGKTCYGHTGGSGSSGAWLAYCPEEKLALAYTSNAKIFPVKDIVAGAFDIFANRPFTPPSFESFAVSPELLDSYAGVYIVPGTPARIVIARAGASLSFQPPNSPAVTLEATAANVFKLEPFLTVEFDAAKQEMTVTRAGQKRLFRKEQ